MSVQKIQISFQELYINTPCDLLELASHLAHLPAIGSVVWCCLLPNSLLGMGVKFRLLVHLWWTFWELLLVFNLFHREWRQGPQFFCVNIVLLFVCFMAVRKTAVLYRKQICRSLFQKPTVFHSSCNILHGHSILHSFIFHFCFYRYLVISQSSQFA